MGNIFGRENTRLIRTAPLWLAAALATSILSPVARADSPEVWTYQWTPAQKAEATAAGEADGAKSGGPYAIPKGKKIGLILLSGQSASSKRIQLPVEKLAKMFGYDVAVCDPNFDAQKVTQCATSLVAQNVSAVFTISTSPGPMGSALADAKERGIPFIGTVSGVAATPLLIDYGSPGVASAQLSGKWLFAEAAKRKGPSAKLDFTILTAPTVGLANLVEEQQIQKLAAATPNVAITTTHDLDLSNIVQDTINISRQSVQQNPDLAGIWTVCDLCIPLISQAIDGEGLEGAKRPIIAGDYTTGQTIALLRSGKVDAVMDLPLEASVWVAYDQLLGLWSRHKPIDASFDVFQKAYGLKFMEPYLITRDNVGASGPIPVFGPDHESYFLAKWKNEYGLGG
jgi:ABC-type sugar transport system substrate-binding protein